MTNFYGVLRYRSVLWWFGLLASMFLIPIMAMGQADNVTIAVYLPPDGVKIEKNSKTQVTVTVTNISDHQVEIDVPFFLMLRDGVGKESVNRCDSFVGRLEDGGAIPEKYFILKNGEARSFDFDLGKLFVMDRLSSINWFSPLLEEVGGGRYDTVAKVYVVYKAKKTSVSSGSFKVDVEAEKSARCAKTRSR